MRMAGSAVQSLFADMGSPDYSGLSNLGQKARAEEGIQAMKSDAEVDFSHMAGDAKIAKANMQADVIGAQSAAAGQQAMGNMIGSVGGSLGNMFGGFGTAGSAAPATTGFGVTPKISDTSTYAGAFSNPSTYSFNMFGGN